MKGRMMTKEQYYQHLEQENLRLKEEKENDNKMDLFIDTPKKQMGRCHWVKCLAQCRYDLGERYCKSHQKDNKKDMGIKNGKEVRRKERMTNMERIEKEVRHYRFHAYYRCTSCKKYCIYDDIATIIMDDDEWENDQIICDDCVFC